MSETDFLDRRSIRPLGPTDRDAFWEEESGGCAPHEVGRSALEGFRGVAPIRIPATPENRWVLRELRAQELALWDETAGGTPKRLEVPREDREGQLILLLLGGVALALGIQATVAATGFVEGWEAFRGWVGAVINSGLLGGG